MPQAERSNASDKSNREDKRRADNGAGRRAEPRNAGRAEQRDANRAESTEDKQSSTGRRFTKPAEELEKLARALRFTGEQVQGPLAGPISRTADGVENAAQHLREATTEDVMRAIEGFARSQPFAFLGAAALLGFGGARFLKSKASAQPAS